MPDKDHVLVLGPHGRHIEVHKRTQAALPDAFPLAPAPRVRRKPQNHSVTPVAETNTVDEEGATE